LCLSAPRAQRSSSLPLSVHVQLLMVALTCHHRCRATSASTPSPPRRRWIEGVPRRPADHRRDRLERSSLGPLAGVLKVGNDCSAHRRLALPRVDRPRTGHFSRSHLRRTRQKVRLRRTSAAVMLYESTANISGVSSRSYDDHGPRNVAINIHI